jgi:hypothetical protein
MTQNPVESTLDDAEVRMLQRLGAGALAVWARLPRDLQRELFRSAVPDTSAPDARMVREALARLLHDHKDDVDPAAGGGTIP